MHGAVLTWLGRIPPPAKTVGFHAIWEQAAFDKLDSIYGTYTEKSAVKSGFQLPRHCMTSTDLNRIINSDEVRMFRE